MTGRFFIILIKNDWSIGYGYCIAVVVVVVVFSFLFERQKCSIFLHSKCIKNHSSHLIGIVIRLLFCFDFQAYTDVSIMVAIRSWAVYLVLIDYLSALFGGNSSHSGRDENINGDDDYDVCMQRHLNGNKLINTIWINQNVCDGIIFNSLQKKTYRRNFNFQLCYRYLFGITKITNETQNKCVAFVALHCILAIRGRQFFYLRFFFSSLLCAQCTLHIVNHNLYIGFGFLPFVHICMEIGLQPAHSCTLQKFNSG